MVGDTLCGVSLTGFKDVRGELDAVASRLRCKAMPDEIVERVAGAIEPEMLRTETLRARGKTADRHQSRCDEGLCGGAVRQRSKDHNGNASAGFSVSICESASVTALLKAAPVRRRSDGPGLPMPAHRRNLSPTKPVIGWMSDKSNNCLLHRKRPWTRIT